MNKDSHTATDENVFYITKEQFQDKIKAKYRSHAEFVSEYEDAKNGSFFQLMSASAKKLWHTTRDAQSAQPDDILKLFNRGAIKSSRANDVPEGAIVLKKKAAHHLNIKTLAGLGIAAATAAELKLMGDSVQKSDAGAGLKETLEKTIDHIDLDSFKSTADMDAFFNQAYSALNPKYGLRSALEKTIDHFDPDSFKSTADLDAFFEKVKIALKSGDGLKETLRDAVGHIDPDSFKSTADMDAFFEELKNFINPPELKEMLGDAVGHIDLLSFKSGDDMNNFFQEVDSAMKLGTGDKEGFLEAVNSNLMQSDIVQTVVNTVNTNSATMVAAGSALALGALLLSKKPWNAASSFELGNVESKARAQDLIQETAALMDKEFLEHKKRLGEKIYYLDKDSVKSYSADHPAEAAKGFNPGVMLDGQNWKLYVKSTTGKAPDGAIMLELQPKLKAVLGSHLDVKNMEKAVQLYNKATSSSIRTSDAFNFPSKASWYMCQKMIDQALGKDTMREFKHEAAVSVR